MSEAPPKQIRIVYRQNVDYFVESQEQAAQAAPHISQTRQKEFLGVVVIATLVCTFIQQYREGVEAKILILVFFSCLLMFSFFWWLSRRLGFDNGGDDYSIRWTEKDRMRLQETLRRKLGNDALQATCDFDGDGYKIVLDGVISGEGARQLSYRWNSIVRVVERPKGLHVYIRRRTYHWFPRAAFASLEDYRAVITIISARVSKFERLDFGRIALVALGSNLGDSRETVLRAIRQLREFSIRSPLVSSRWQTTPVDCPPGSPMFVNAVVGLQPRKDETPESLLEKLRALEKVFGRKPKNVLNEARPLDLDLIAFGNETRNTERLVLPHPRAYQRRFVLQPLSEIAPDLVLPGQSRTVTELLAGLPPDNTITRIN